MATITRRGLAISSAAVAAALLLAGCSGGSGSTTKASPSAAPTDASGNLTLWVGSWWAPQIPKVTKDFEAAHPKIKLTIDPIPIDGYQDKFTSSTLGGNPPDLVDLDVSWLSSYAGQKLLQPVTDVANTLNPKAYAPGPWDSSRYKGVQYAIPDRSSSIALYYNKTLFQQAGLAVPSSNWTWNDMVADAKKLTDPSKKQYGIGFAADLSDPQNAMDTLSTALWSHGGDFLNASSTKSVLNSKASIAGLTAWADLYTKDKVAPPGTPNFATTRDVVPQFQAGQLGMFIGGSNNNPTLDSTKGLEWGTVLVPGKTNTSGGYTMAIPVGAQNPAAAKVFLEWFSDPKVQATEAVRTPAILASLNMPPWNGPEFTTFNEATKYAKSLPTVASWTQDQTIIITDAQKMLVGQFTPKQAADDMTAQINAQLAKTGNQ